MASAGKSTIGAFQRAAAPGEGITAWLEHELLSLVRFVAGAWKQSSL